MSDAALREEWVRAVEAENDQLRERVRLLERLLGLGFVAPPCLGLTGSEARLLGLLCSRNIVTKDGAMVLLYGNRPDGDGAEIRTVDVFICKLRRKLEAVAIAIRTQWGIGYWMDANAKAAVAKLFPERRAA